MRATAALSNRLGDVLLYPAWLVDDLSFRLFAFLEEVRELTLEIEQRAKRNPALQSTTSDRYDDNIPVTMSFNQRWGCCRTYAAIQWSDKNLSFTCLGYHIMVLTIISSFSSEYHTWESCHYQEPQKL
jgi:hypothetical protein